MKETLTDKLIKCFYGLTGPLDEYRTQQVNRGWAKSPSSLLRARDNILTQWLIGRFVRVLHSKSDLINCAGVGRRTLFLTCRVLSHSLLLLGYE